MISNRTRHVSNVAPPGGIVIPSELLPGGRYGVDRMLIALMIWPSRSVPSHPIGITMAEKRLSATASRLFTSSVAA